MDTNKIAERVSASPLSKGLADRLCRYAEIETTSDHHVETIPSTQCQWELARLLAQELKAMGVGEVSLDDHAYLIARVPASPGREGADCIGLMAHIDTASDVCGKGVRPIVTKNYSGSAIELAEGNSLDPAEFPELLDRIGDTIISSSGDTLLGADDKAGLSILMTALEWLLSHPEITHGPLEFIFTPDEETGKGMDLFPLKSIRAKACYTFDGGPKGEIESECFNAWKAEVGFFGKAIHVGKARGKLANATSMAASFISMLPRSESPESTDALYGYYSPMEITGNLERAKLEVLLRDFEDEGMERRRAALLAFARSVEAQFPGGRVEVKLSEQYENMREKIGENPLVLERLLLAAKSVGVEPTQNPIRGGTDGSRLTAMGIPTPNVFTGSYNFHSKREWASLETMICATELALALIGLWASD